MRNFIKLKNVIGSAECASSVCCDKCLKKMKYPDTYHHTSIDYEDYVDTLDLCCECFKKVIQDKADDKDIMSFSSYIDYAPTEIVQDAEVIDFYSKLKEVESSVRSAKFIIEGEIEKRITDDVLIAILSGTLKDVEHMISLYSRSDIRERMKET